jgi:hypothetical protein
MPAHTLQRRSAVVHTQYARHYIRASGHPRDHVGCLRGSNVYHEADEDDDPAKLIALGPFQRRHATASYGTATPLVFTWIRRVDTTSIQGQILG